MAYRFRVGVKSLPFSKLIDLRSGGYNHACLLLNEDLFEYNLQFSRHKNVGRDSSFDWEELGEELHGTTNISPDELEIAIVKDGSWFFGHYNLFKHNCHDFVKFCLKKLGCPDSMCRKVGPCFKNQKNEFVIRSALAEKNLDIRGNNITDWTDIILYIAHAGESQTFTKQFNADGSISFIKYGYAIDVRGGKAENETQIQILENMGSLSQKFYLKERENGFVSIHSALNQRYVIDVLHSGTHDGNKIQLWEENGTKAQMFKFIDKFQIRSALGNVNLDVNGNIFKNGTNIILYKAHGGESQTFIKHNNNDGTFTFKKNGFAIDVRNGQVGFGTIIQIWECNNTLSQKFYLKDRGEGYVSIHSALDQNYVIDVLHSGTHDGNKIQLCGYNGTNAQKFRFI